MKKFRIGVIAESFKLPFEESLKQAKALGADGVQLTVAEDWLNPDKMTDEQCEYVKQKLAENGLVLTAVCGDFGGHGFQIAEDNAWKVPKSKRVVDMALKLGTNIVTTHIGVIPEDTECETYKIMHDACNELAEYASSRNAFFAVETGPEPSARLKSFLDSLSTNGVGVNFDPANLAMVIGEDAVEAVRNLKDYIVHTHAKDGIRKQVVDPVVVYDFFADGGIEDLRLDECFKEVPLGQGSVNFEGYLKELEQFGYDGFLTIEREVGATPQEDIEIAVNFLNNLMKQ